MYEGKLNQFLATLQDRNPSVYEIVQEQIKFVGSLKEIAKDVKTMKKDIDKKKE